MRTLAVRLATLFVWSALAASVVAQDAPAPSDSLAALEKELADLRRGIRQDEILTRATALAEKAKGPESAKLATIIAETTREKQLLEKAGPLERVRKRNRKLLIADLATIEKDARLEVALASFCFLLGMEEPGLAAAGRARDRSPDVRGETDRLLAAFRKTRVPRGGYHRYRGEWLALRERDRRRALDDALERLEDAKPEGFTIPFEISRRTSNHAAFASKLGDRKGAELFRSAAAALRETLTADYDVPRRWYLSYARDGALRRRLLARREAMAEPRKKALDLIRRYDKPQQGQVDAWRKKLERMYAEYRTDRRTDMRRFDSASPHDAWELMRSIERKERALEAIDRWLSGWSRPGLGEAPIAPPAGAATNRRHLLPGRRQSGLEDVLWLLVRYRAGRIIDVLGRSAEIMRNRRKLTDWELMVLEDLRADAIDLYNSRVATSLDTAERQFVTVLNGYRRALGRPPLEIEERLAVSARKHSQEMQDLGYFGHISPVARNRTPADRARLEGYDIGGLAENCLGGRTDGRGAFEGWYHSPGHHRGMVFSGPHVGIGATPDHGLWTMVAGGTDLSWRHLHRDIHPKRRDEMHVALDEWLTAIRKDKEIEVARARCERLLPDILPVMARRAFPAVSARGELAALFPTLLDFIVHAPVHKDWRPLQVAAVAASIDSLRHSPNAKARKAALVLVEKHVGETFGYNPTASMTKRRKPVLEMRRLWEDDAHHRYRPSGIPVVKKVAPAGRVGDGPSMESPLRVLSKKERLRLAKKFGGGTKTEKAVEKGLAWLAGIQEPDGSWRARSFPSTSKKFAKVRNLGVGQGEYEVAMTGLSLLAFVTAGNTTHQGEYSDNVHRAAEFLLQRIIDYGKFETTAGHYMYNHAIATQALSELYAHTADPRIGIGAQLAVDYLMYAQHAESGGWRYQAKERGDTSVTGWVILALNAAFKAKLDVAGFRGAIRFLDSVTQPGYYKVGYMSPYDNGTHRNRLGAVAMVGRLFMGEQQKDPRLVLIAHRLKEEAPHRGRQDFYYWYYATLGMFQMGDHFWEAWNGALVPTLLETQVRGDTPLEGSWAPHGDFSNHAGRVYQTCLGILMLTTYYRYDRAPKVKVYSFTGDLEEKSAPYLEALKESDDDQVKAITMRKMVDRFGSALAPVLVRKLREEKVADDLRRRCAVMLMDCADETTEGALLDLLGREKNHVVLGILVQALERVCSTASIPTLIRCLDHGNRTVRVQAARVLGRVGDARAAGAISTRIGVERDNWAKDTMNRALGTLAHREAVEEIVDAACGKKVRGKIRILEGLRLFEASGVGKLLLATREREPKIWAAALDHVEKHREASAVPVLIELLESDDKDTREQSHKLLRAITGKGFAFDPGWSEKRRKVASVQWRKWWEEELKKWTR